MTYKRKLPNNLHKDGNKIYTSSITYAIYALWHLECNIYFIYFMMHG